MRFIAVICAILYAFNAWLGATVGTRNQGDDSEFIASVFLSIPLFLTAFLCLWFSRKVDDGSIQILYVVVLSAVFALWIWLPIFWRTTIVGYDLCAYGLIDVELEGYLFERTIPVWHLFFSGVLILMTYPVWKKLFKK